MAANAADNVQTISILLLPFLLAGMFITADLSIKENVIYVCKLFFLILCIDYVVEEFVCLIRPFRMSDEVAWFISNLMSLFLYALICIIRRKEKIENNPQMQTWKKIILYGCIVVMAIAMPLAISGLNFFAERSREVEEIKGIQLLSAVSMLGMVMLIVFVIYINDTNKKMKQYLEIEQVLKENQKNYYEAVIQKEEDTRRFRHDILNHMICIRELAERSELEAVKQYIDEVQGELVKIQKHCYSVGNIVMDAVLNHYLQTLQEYVKVQVTGYFVGRVCISDAELCTIFSNIMRNCVEELKMQQNSNKYLKIKIYTTKDAFTVEVCNSAQRKREKGSEGLPETTKEDRKNHGIGLKNIKETVERNKGIFLWESTVEEFKVKVILPLRLRG